MKIYVDKSKWSVQFDSVEINLCVVHDIYVTKNEDTGRCANIMTYLQFVGV